MDDIKIGIDLGGSHVSVGVVDSTNQIIEQYEKDFTVEEKKDLINVAIEYIVETVNKLKRTYKFSKIGIGMAGTIRDGVVISSSNIGIKNFNIKKLLEDKTGLEVNISNDAMCAAIGEYVYSNLREYEKILFLTLGTGIGGNILYKGKIMENSEYQELGHTVIKENGVQCKCGKKGCFERYGSILVFKNKIIERLGLSYDISGPDLRKEIKNNLEKVKDIIEEYLNDLVIGLIMLINNFNPDIVVIGGGFTRYEYMLFEPLKEKLYKSEELIFKNVKIQTAKSGNDAGIIGASFFWGHSFGDSFGDTSQNQVDDQNELFYKRR